MRSEREMAVSNCILKIRTGSDLYGAVIPGKSDTDYIGVCIEDPDYVVGNYIFKAYVERRDAKGVLKLESKPGRPMEPNKPGDIDMTIFGLRRFITLLEANNPTMLEILYAHENCIVYKNSYGQRLLDARDLFPSVKIKSGFLGYAYDQRMRMLPSPGETGHRVQEMGDLGYKVKYASHTIRLLNFGIEFLKEGKLTLPTKINNLLIDIKKGKYGLDDILLMYDKLKDQIETAYLLSNLPAEPDHNKISIFQKEMYLDYWGGKNLE